MDGDSSVVEERGAASITKLVNREEGAGGEAGEDMGLTGGNGESGKVQEASVRGCDGAAIRELYVDGFGGQFDVGTWFVNHEEVAIAPAVGNREVLIICGGGLIRFLEWLL